MQAIKTWMKRMVLKKENKKMKNFKYLILIYPNITGQLTACSVWQLPCPTIHLEDIAGLFLLSKPKNITTV